MTGAREYEAHDENDVTPDLPPVVEAPDVLPGRGDRDGGDGGDARERRPPVHRENLDEPHAPREAGACAQEGES
jgi:hypothetical protein